MCKNIRVPPPPVPLVTTYTNTFKLISKRWQLSCNPFWCDITLNFLLNNFSLIFLPVIVEVIVLRTDTIEKNIFLKPLKGNTNIGDH